MIQDCNWNHLRLYAPENSHLVNSGIYPIEADLMVTEVEWSGETREITNDLAGFTVFENLRLIPAGRSSEFTVDYEVNSVVSQNAAGANVYRLNLIRQAGVYPYPPTTVSVTLPADSSFISASIEPISVSGNTLMFSTTLSENQLLEIVFQ